MTYRTCLVLGSVVAAIFLAWLYTPPPQQVLLVPEPSPAKYAVLAIFWWAWCIAMFFVILAPVWLPVAVSERLRRTLKAIRVLCGSILLFVSAVLLALMIMEAAVSFVWGTVALVAGVIGGLHIRAAFRTRSVHVA